MEQRSRRTSIHYELHELQEHLDNRFDKLEALIEEETEMSTSQFDEIETHVGNLTAAVDALVALKGSSNLTADQQTQIDAALDAVSQKATDAVNPPAPPA